MTDPILFVSLALAFGSGIFVGVVAERLAVPNARIIPLPRKHIRIVERDKSA
jgi:hypothetical protein